MIKNRIDTEYGAYPTLKEINRDLKELLNEVKNIKTVKMAKEFVKHYNWFTLEINGDLLKDSTDDNLEVEWIRYENYGCLSYIYVRTDGRIYFDVWSNKCQFEFIDGTDGINEEFYNKCVKDAEYFLKNGKWE